MLKVTFMSNHCEIILRWMPRNTPFMISQQEFMLWLGLVRQQTIFQAVVDLEFMSINGVISHTKLKHDCCVIYQVETHAWRWLSPLKVRVVYHSTQDRNVLTIMQWINIQWATIKNMAKVIWDSCWNIRSKKTISSLETWKMFWTANIVGKNYEFIHIFVNSCRSCICVCVKTDICFIHGWNHCSIY